MRTARSSVSPKRRNGPLLALGLLAAQHAGVAHAGDDETEKAGDLLRVALPAAAYALTFKHDDQEARPQFYKSFGATVVGTSKSSEVSPGVQLVQPR